MTQRTSDKAIVGFYAFITMLVAARLVMGCGGSVELPDHHDEDAGGSTVPPLCRYGEPTGWITPTGCGCDSLCITTPHGVYVHDQGDTYDCWPTDPNYKVDVPTCTFAVR